ncbi:MAG: hypothetical protein AMXMBFR33_08000 [Candidatus Xenobia bacterium]
MLIRKFDRTQLDSEPHNVLFKDLYPWDAIGETPFGASLALVEVGGETMLHSHHPAETFFICQGRGTMTVNGETTPVSTGDVIYLPPGSQHTLKNTSEGESLMFLSVFWDAEQDEEAEPEQAQEQPRLFFPSPPTPNGPLHLGHLSGPYLAAEVLRRYDRMRGLASRYLCLADDHQSYVVLRSELEESTPAETAIRYADQAVTLLEAFDAAPDLWVFSSRDERYQEAVRQALDQLKLEEREEPALYCPSCEHYLVDGRAAGDCPHCGESCRGFLCESCCLPNRTIDLLEPTCIDCKAAAALKPLKQLFFSLEPWRERLLAYHGSLRLSPRLLSLVARIAQLSPLELTASHPGRWGIPSPLEGQVISPWLEAALALPYLRARAGLEGPMVASFGADNAFLYLFQDPAVALALGQQPAAQLVSNEHLMLDERKMSTSAAHALNAAAVLEKVPSDLVRLFLATVRPEQADSSCSLEAMEHFLQQSVVRPWQDLLERIGRQVTAEAGSKAPAVGVWSPEQYEFLERLNELLTRAESGYTTGSLREVARALHELIERVAAFEAAQSYLARVPGLESQRATALALMLAALRLLATIAQPLMPRFSALLNKHLGFLKPEPWPEEVLFLNPGQRILAAAGLSARRYF